MKADIDHNSASPIVFYDGACPLCSREIAHYRKLRGSDQLRWIDVHHDHGLLQQHGLSKATALARFHVLDAEGEWKTGAHGFVEIWSYLSRWHLLARWVTMLRLTPALDWGYGHFARWRQRRSCENGQCKLPDSRG